MMTLLVLLCQSTVLLSLGLLALRLTRKRGPAVQTLVGRAALSGVALLLLLLPLSGRIAPVWRMPAEPTPVRQEPTPVRPSPALPKREGAEVQPVGARLAAPSAISAPPEPLPVVTSRFAPPPRQRQNRDIKKAQRQQRAQQAAPLRRRQRSLLLVLPFGEDPCEVTCYGARRRVPSGLYPHFSCSSGSLSAGGT